VAEPRLAASSPTVADAVDLPRRWSRSSELRDEHRNCGCERAGAQASTCLNSGLTGVPTPGSHRKSVLLVDTGE
jgi:hypothetical protein